MERDLTQDYKMKEEQRDDDVTHAEEKYEGVKEADRAATGEVTAP